ncbi:MAG: lipoprotein signal peptidase [Bacteroidales bacterium]|nr:lipoprotein signal peptidase [Bacteroidales bacterium]
MTTQKKQYITIALIVGLVIVIDQVIKILVKTNMQIGESIPLIGNWCQLLFVENEGMAFGMAFGGFVGKLLLSLFRIVAATAVMWYLLVLVRKKQCATGVLISLSLIFAGAIGNLIDCAFYGLIFNESYYHVATMFPPEGGYAPFLHGRVVDMFYFPLIHTTIPSWMPIWGGQPFTFFNAIFNFADAAITVGVFWLLIYSLLFHKNNSESADDEKNQK